MLLCLLFSWSGADSGFHCCVFSITRWMAAPQRLTGWCVVLSCKCVFQSRASFLFGYLSSLICKLFVRRVSPHFLPGSLPR